MIEQKLEDKEFKLEVLRNFFNYEPVFSQDPQFLVDKIKQKAWKYLSKKDLDIIQKTYEFAREAHRGSTRLSWEPYIIHPVKATLFLMKINPELSSIQACLLHDVIEDTPKTFEDVKKTFWNEVANLCEWLVKVSKVRYNPKTDSWDLIETWEDRQIETLKKTFIAMWKDLRVIFIKLADRIHNIQTLKYHPKIDKRKRIAEETLKIFVPIAQRLWLQVFQLYLENWAFKILYPKEFNRIINYIERKYLKWAWYIEEWIEMLWKILKKEKMIKFYDIKWRFKSPYRIYKKLQKYKTNDISKIMDILAFRIITDTVWNCYNILWILHSYYTPIIKRIKDYISIPKANWYSSLHTTILWMFKFPIEIQIRTKEMDEVAEYWVAAHFAYKEQWLPVSVSQEQAEWIKKLQDIVSSFQKEPDKEKFKNELNVEILERDIFVYTPDWDIKQLPRWSNVLDFAFRIHTDIWLKFKNAFVNSMIVPIDYVLKNWDIVEIKSYKQKDTASKSWLDIVHTPSAKWKINKYIKQLEKEKYMEEAEKMINNKLKTLKLPKLWSKEDKITKKYKWDALEDLFIKIYDKQMSITSLLKEFYESKIKEKDYNIDLKLAEREAKKEKSKKSLENMIIIDFDKELSYTLCQECNPIPWDKIIAKSDKKWIKIHSLKCKALEKISYEKLMEAHWRWEEPKSYILELWLEINDKPWVLLNILSIFSDLNINIYSVHVWKNEERWVGTVNINLEFPNPWKIQFILNELKKQWDFVKIVKTGLK